MGLSTVHRANILGDNIVLIFFTSLFTFLNNFAKINYLDLEYEKSNKIKKNKSIYKCFKFIHTHSISNENTVLVIHSSLKCSRFNYKVRDLKSILLEKKRDWNARRDTSEATVLEGTRSNHSADFTTRVLNLNRRTVSAGSSFVERYKRRTSGQFMSHNFHRETKVRVAACSRCAHRIAETFQKIERALKCAMQHRYANYSTQN